MLSATSKEEEEAAAAGHRGTNAGTYLLRSVGEAIEAVFSLNFGPQGLLGRELGGLYVKMSSSPELAATAALSAMLLRLDTAAVPGRRYQALAHCCACEG